VLGVSITQLVAEKLGGAGSYDDLAYAYASFYVPLILVGGVLNEIPCVFYLIPFVCLYMLALAVIAVKAVHRLEWIDAFAAAIVAPGILMFLVCCLFVCGLAGSA
jgi:hypothetical protein